MRKLWILIFILVLGACTQKENDISDLDIFNDFVVSSNDLEYFIEYGETADIENMKYEILKDGRGLEDVKVDSKDFDKDSVELKTTSGMLSIKVQVVDTVPPKLTGVKTIEVEQDEKIDLTKYFDAVDAVDGELKVKVPKLDTSKVGKQKLKVSATDKNGNTATKKFTVNVVKPEAVVVPSAPQYSGNRTAPNNSTPPTVTQAPSQNNQGSKPTQNTAPKPTPAPAPAPQNTAVRNSSEVYEMHAIVNEERSRQGLRPLKFSQRLYNSADIRAREIVQSFSHTRPGGGNVLTMDDRLINGENVAFGYNSPAIATQGFLDSPGHRANVLNPKFVSVAYALEKVNGVYYWVQLFSFSDL